MKIAIQMDEISTINPNTDSTYLLAQEAQRRGFSLFYYTVYDVYLKGSEVYANLYPITFKDDINDYFELGQKIENKLNEFDLILIRQDPPFDMRYITNSYLLSMLEGRVKFINNPSAIRNHSEKIYAHKFAEYMPKTIVSENLEILENYFKRLGDVVLKPLYAFGGRDVELVKKGDKNFKEVASKIIQKYQAPIIIQAFIPEVTQGDTRVLVACGQIVGQILRIPAENQITANLCHGGTASKATLSDRQIEIANIIASDCHKNGLYFVGLDFIGDHLTEINVTSPTGIKQASLEMQKDIAKEIWDLFLENM